MTSKGGLDYPVGDGELLENSEYLFELNQLVREAHKDKGKN